MSSTEYNKGKAVLVHAKKVMEGVEVWLYSFWTLALMDVSGKLHTLGKEPWYPLNSTLGGSTNGLDVWDKTEVSYTCQELNHDLSSGVQPVS